MPPAVTSVVRVVCHARWAALLALSCLGCQTAVPRDWAGLNSVREEQKILKLAQRDPFPSPKDVGLDAPTPVP